VAHAGGELVMSTSWIIWLAIKMHIVAMNFAHSVGMISGETLRSKVDAFARWAVTRMRCDIHIMSRNKLPVGFVVWVPRDGWMTVAYKFMLGATK